MGPNRFEYLRGRNEPGEPPQPRQERTLQEKLADRTVSADTIDGEARKVDSADVDAAASNW